jgi:Tol biopolymer transport system component
MRMVLPDPRRFILGLALVALLAGCGGDSDPAGPASRQSRIVFASARITILPEIYVMNADGTDQIRLTYSSAGGGQPSWSPDGSSIVFHRRWQDATQRWWSGIFRMKDDGSEQVCIDSIADVFRVSPRFSPDGSKIAFCQLGGRFEVWVMNADGSGAVNLTPDPGQGADPDWSPDGTRIVYSRNVPGLGWRIYTMRSDGSDTVKVVETGVPNSHQTEPRWSHDGTRIAYVDNRGVNTNPNMNWIYVVHPDGSNPTPVTPLTDGYRDWPSWSPDDRKIAYRDNYRNGNVADAEIYTINVDGSEETDVSRFAAGHDFTPDWGPEP